MKFFTIIKGCYHIGSKRYWFQFGSGSKSLLVPLCIQIGKGNTSKFLNLEPFNNLEPVVPKVDWFQFV